MKSSTPENVKALKKSKKDQKALTLYTLIGLTAIGLFLVLAWGLQKRNSKVASLKKTDSRESLLEKAKANYLIQLKSKTDFLLTLIPNSTKEESVELKKKIIWLSQIRLTGQDDFDRIEILQSQIDEVVLNGLQCALPKEECPLANEVDTQRVLERLDRSIDMARLTLSKITYRIVDSKSRASKLPFFKRSQVEIPHFRVDHQILAKNGR